MSGSYLLDTNVVIALFDQHPNVLDELARAHAIFMASTVLGELYYGAHYSAQVVPNLARVTTLARNNTVLVCDEVTALYYGQVKAKLRAKGKPIPENDIWIAALALQHQLTLATWDGHFDEVDGLQTVKW
jgi:tRNA(fMet)-specific endonuclease VapC